MRFGNILVGADPELFLTNPNNGSFMSAHKYVKGTKYEPFKVDRGAVQLDGTAAEFNIDPARTPDEFVGNIRTVMDQLDHMVRPSGYKLTAVPVADFDPRYFAEDIPFECKVLGCDPDFDAWTLEPNVPPNAEVTYRTGSGHVHVGWGNNFDCYDLEHFETCAAVARQLDYYLGIWSLLWDKDNRRRSLYGKAGAFRPKPYGVEYRVLSNSWLRSELMQRWVFHAVKTAMDDLDGGLVYEDFHKDRARSIINENIVDWWREPGAPSMDHLPFPPGVNLKAA